MSDFFGRLALRAQGQVPVVRPLLAPRMAPVASALRGEEIAPWGARADERDAGEAPEMAPRREAAAPRVAAEELVQRAAVPVGSPRGAARGDDFGSREPVRAVPPSSAAEGWGAREGVAREGAGERHLEQAFTDGDRAAPEHAKASGDGEGRAARAAISSDEGRAPPIVTRATRASVTPDPFTATHALEPAIASAPATSAARGIDALASEPHESGPRAPRTDERRGTKEPREVPSAQRGAAPYASRRAAEPVPRLEISAHELRRDGGARRGEVERRIPPRESAATRDLDPSVAADLGAPRSARSFRDPVPAARPLDPGSALGTAARAAAVRVARDAALGLRAGAPSVNITIGRVEVRGIAPPRPVPAVRPASAAHPSRISLDDYLKQRGGGRR